jgi:subtilisin-like proprotein convertase family protein
MVAAGESKANETLAAEIGRSTVVIVPTSPEGNAALSFSGVRVVARYEAFTLVEATGKAVIKRLVAAGGEVRDDMRRVRVGTLTFDPKVADQHVQAKTGQAMRIADKGGTGMVLVQYVGPLKPEWVAAVQATGVDIVTYMAQNAQLVAGDPAALAAVSQLAASRGYIRAVIPYTAAAKMLPGLQRAGSRKVVISTVAGKAGDASRAAIRGLSTPNGQAVPVAGIVQHRVTMDAARVGEVAELGGVVAIEPEVEPKLHDERNSMILANKLSGSFQPVFGTGYLQYLASKGFSTNSTLVIDITDEGIDKGMVPVPAGSHPAFFRLGNTASPSRIVYAQEATAGDANARDCGGHGTNVASIATGYSALTGAAHEDAQGFNFALGVSPFSRVGATKIFNCAGAFDVATSITALHSAAFAAGARISNNSWGAAVGGAYNTRAQEFDALVRDVQPAVAGNQPFIEVVSAGNSGAGGNTIGSPGTAKNVITVGASESVRAIGATDGCGVPDTGANSARDIINFSSRGPTDDGRIKPDIVAPGTHVAGAQPQVGADFNGSGTCNPQFPAGSTLYTLVSGTSQAAPVVTGFASLIYQWYQSKNAGVAPSPALTKALMINTASDLVGGDAGNGTLNANIPTQIQGWGRVNLDTLLDNTSRQFVDQAQRFAGTGAVRDRYFNIASAAKPLKVSLVWTDAVGPTVGNSFVNDLDLEVYAGGQVYKGNVLVGGQSVTGGTADPANNVENVFLPAGITGPVKVRVIAKNIAGDGVPGNSDVTDQDYALVASNVGAAVGSLAVLQATSKTLTPLGDGDATLEKGEPFTLRVNLKNVGNKTATAVSGTLTAPASDATITQANATWADIIANGSKASTLMKGTVKSTLACGKVVRLTLAGSANGTPFSVPVPIRTGKPGTARTFTPTDLPKAIPDNNPAGVTSDMTVTGGGTLADLEVKIGQITHTFVGDLQIDLTSPAGTTVRLIDRVGGSGDNFTNTVLSDDAATAITAGAAPFSGTFRPAQPLSGFDGELANGVWKLTVKDLAGGDSGTLSNWSVSRKIYVCD